MSDDVMMSADDVVPDDEAPRKRGPKADYWTPERRAEASRKAKERAAQRSDAAPRPLSAQKRAGKALAKKLTGAIQFVGSMAAVREPFDGAVITAAAPRLGETYAAVLERHPKALAYLTALESGGVYGAAILATLTVALPILAHHRALPEQLFPLAVMVSPVDMGVPMTMNGAGHPAGD